jgi:hypothetical protein
VRDDVAVIDPLVSDENNPVIDESAVVKKFVDVAFVTTLLVPVRFVTTLFVVVPFVTATLVVTRFVVVAFVAVSAAMRPLVATKLVAVALVVTNSLIVPFEIVVVASVVVPRAVRVPLEVIDDVATILPPVNELTVAESVFKTLAKKFVDVAFVVFTLVSVAFVDERSVIVPVEIVVVARLEVPFTVSVPLDKIDDVAVILPPVNVPIVASAD